MRFYALSTRPWVEGEGGGHWGLPPGTIGSVDLAPTGGPGHVFVTSDKPFAAADVEVAIGDGTWLDSYVPTAAEQAAWETLVGVAFQPGWTLLEALWATLTSEADPDGVRRAKPLMPTHKGMLELHLGGHSVIRSERLPADPTTHPAWSNIQRVLQNDYRVLQGRDRRLARKWLGAQAGKYRLTPEAARDLIVPADLPRELPQRPTTAIAESFDQADSTTLGPDLTWTETTGNLETRSNRAGVVGNSGFAEARAEHDLSADDMHVSVTIHGTHAGTTDSTRALARFDPAARTHYGANATEGDLIALFRRANGSFTALSSGAAPYLTDGSETIACEVDGTTIRALLSSTLIVEHTDTSITGFARAGFALRDDGEADTFVAADLLAGTELVTVQSEAVGTGQVVQRLRDMARVHGDLVGIAAAVAALGGAVSAAAAIISDAVRMRVGAASRLSDRPAARMNVPPARR